MKLCKRLLIIFATAFLVLVTVQNEVNAEILTSKVFLSKDDIQMSIRNGKVIVSSNIYNLSNKPVYVESVMIRFHFWLDGNRYALPDKYFNCGDMYLAAGQKTWKTFTIYDDSIPNISSGSHNFRSENFSSIVFFR